MMLLLASAVGIPILAIILFTVLEAIGETTGLWEKISKVAFDLCIISIGIVGGIFVNVQLAERLGQGRTVLAVMIVLMNMILAGFVMLVRKRAHTWDDRTKASLNLFLGIVAVSIPTGIIIWVGGQQ